jgi:hypothetical protein
MTSGEQNPKWRISVRSNLISFDQKNWDLVGFSVAQCKNGLREVFPANRLRIGSGSGFPGENVR